MTVIQFFKENTLKCKKFKTAKKKYININEILFFKLQYHKENITEMKAKSFFKIIEYII